jgi:hypothetical protein
MVTAHAADRDTATRALPYRYNNMSREELVIQFEELFLRLLAREHVDLYAAGLSYTFEVIAGTLLGASPGRERCFFDGVVGLRAQVKSPRKVEFQGEMWVGSDREQWKEPFRATAVDKRMTKQGICITLAVGSDRAEAELSSAFQSNSD